MKSVLVILGAFALAVCVFPTDANEVEAELPPNLMDLPLELRLDIFEQLDFKALVSISRTNRENRNTIERIFRNVLKNPEFRVRFDKHTQTLRISYDSTEVASIAYEDVRENLEAIAEFFQYFGHCITKLEYEYDSSVHSLCEQVHERIGKYVAGSVIEINFTLGDYTDRQAINGSLKDLIASYPKCKVARLVNSAIGAETLHRMFPAVQDFDLSLTEINESLGNFPYLERLKTPLDWLQNKSYLPLFKETIELNPQLKHLFIGRCDDWDILKTLNEVRPDFESLEIWGLNFNDPVDAPLRFANMKVFKYRNIPMEEIVIDRFPLEFGNLEEILFESAALTHLWIDILVQNKELRKVSSVHTLERNHLEQIVSGLPNLEEFAMECANNEPKPIQDIVELLQGAKQLKKICLSHVGADACDAAALRLTSEWEIAGKGFICCFARKSFN